GAGGGVWSPRGAARGGQGGSASPGYGTRGTRPGVEGAFVAVQLLHYRPWRGKFHSPAWSVWPVARLSLAMVFRRKLFWILYGLALFIFLMFFFGQYLLFFAEAQTEARVSFGGVMVPTRDL